MTEFHFRAMASNVHVILVDAEPDAAPWVESRIRELEQRWSRFLPNSDLSMLNRIDNGRLRVSGDTIALIESMQLAHVATDGRYDPTMLFEICEAGYSSSTDDPRRISVMVDLPAPGRSIHDVVIDRRDSTVWMPGGVGIDPGGIGKGLAGDMVVSALLLAGAARGALVSIGGDIAVAGRPPAHHGIDRWHVAIDDPLKRCDEVLRVGLDGGGVATSSTRSRRWTTGRRSRHHILDPASRREARSDIASVSVVAGAGWVAEAHATAAILEGPTGAVAYLDRCGLEGVMVTSDGEMECTAALHSDLVRFGLELAGAHP